jgi:LPS-assembly lipoprotein
MRGLVAPALLALVALSGCGLRPVYAGGGKGPVAATLALVAVAPIPGKVGYLVQGALTDRLRGDGAAPTRLEVELEDRITGFGLRSDQSVTRQRRTLRARYRLVDAAAGTVLLDATASADAGIDVVSSEYALIAAEQTALERLSSDIADQIVARLALYAQRSGTPAR